MDKLEATLEILFAENLEDLEHMYDIDNLARALNMSLRWNFGTDNWDELRTAAKAALLETLRRVPAAVPAPEDRMIDGLPASSSPYARIEITYRDSSKLVSAVRMVRETLGLGLREAKEFVQDHNPPYLEIKRDVAMRLQEKLLEIDVRARVD